MNRVGLVGGIDEADVVQEAVFLLQGQQVGFGRHVLWTDGAGQNDVQVADGRLRRFAPSSLRCNMADISVSVSVT